VRRLVEDAYALTIKIIINYRDKLDEIARRLLDEETLDAKGFAAIFDGMSPEGVSLTA
jgi:ATP-dependent Zn protease